MRSVNNQIDDLFSRILLRVGKTNTTSDVTKSFWPRQNGRQFWPEITSFSSSQNSTFGDRIPPKKLTIKDPKCKISFSRLATVLLALRWIFSNQYFTWKACFDIHTTPPFQSMIKFFLFPMNSYYHSNGDASF